jgi:sulfur transfer complex TusBCD TusB component (DsrH family)
MKVLQIIETAYRATIEEQDDTVVWITHAMKGAGGDLDVLLRGNAVNYALRGQDASGLAFGEWQQTRPPRLADDIAGLIGKGVDVYYVQDDAVARGISESALVERLKPIPRNGLAGLLGAYDQVWHW